MPDDRWSATPQLTRLPPHNDEAEMALLGALLHNNATYDRISDQLRPEHFANRTHGRLYAAIGTLIERGQVADPITLRQAFTDDPDLGKVGPEYLMQLAGSVTSVFNAPDYARAIVDLALRRQLIEACQDGMDRAYTDDLDRDARGQIEDLESTLYQLAQTGGEPIRPVDVKKIINRIDSIARGEPAPTGINLGLSALSTIIPGLLPDQLVIVAARPSMGKSALALGFAEAALAHGQVLFFSLEMSAEQVLGRRLALATGIPTERQRIGPISPAEARRIADAAVQLSRDGLIVNDRRGITMSAIRAESRRRARRGGLSMIVIDYLGLIGAGPSARRDANRVQEISAITAQCKALAGDLAVPVVLLSQLNRSLESRDDKRPHLADLRDSGSIEQDADIVMFVHRDEYFLTRDGEPRKTERETEAQHSERWAKWSAALQAAKGRADIIVAKQRDGRTGSVVVGFNGAITKFHDLDREAA